MKPGINPVRCGILRALPGLLLIFLTVGCVVRWHHHHSSHQSTISSTSGYPWPEKDKMVLRYQVRDGRAALETERVVLVFDGLTPVQQQLFHFQGKEQAIQIGGNGTSSVSVTCATEKGKVAFRSDYADGTNALHLNEQTVRFTQGGRLLLMGEQAVDLNEGRKVVHVKHGRAGLE